MAVLAKLSPPRTAGVFPRERLFARLDECLRHAAVWISGPPGAGKTTLAASYLESRRLRALWYQVDPGDADPASFFYYLAIGARKAGLSKKVHLAPLTPEYMPDLAGFTRRFVRSMCEGMPQPFVLVLDNVHEAPEASPFGAVLRDALAELPAGINAICVSRAEPPAEHARLRASQGIVEVGWDELRLSEDEATQIAANSHAFAPPDVDALVKRSAGWAAGLRLLLDHARATGSVAAVPKARQALFDYFAAELFDRLPPDTRHLLLSTTLLPWVSVEMAQALTHNGAAGALLEGLRRKQLFTDRRDGPIASYRYHALFREFLSNRVQSECTPEEQIELARASAQLLAHAGEDGEALQLYLAAGDHGAAVQLVLGNAPRLAAQGRLQTLREWIGALPEPLVETVPWLAYWLSMCEFGRNLLVARARLEEAFKSFGDTGDVLGQAVTAAGIIDTHIFESRNFTQLDPWIEKLQGLVDRDLRFPNAGVELRLVGALVGALAMRKPDREPLPRYVARLLLLLDEAPDVNSRIEGASRLLHYYVFLQETHPGARLIANMRPHLHDPLLSPNNKCNWLNFQSLFFELIAYDAREANHAIDTALEVMECHGLHHFAILLRGRAAMVRLEAADVEGARFHLAQVVPNLGVDRFDTDMHTGLQSWVALAAGDHQTALTHAERLAEAAAKTGLVRAHSQALLWSANALAAAGDVRGAFECTREVRDERLVPTPLGDFSVNLVEADLHLREGRQTQAVALLRNAMKNGRQERMFNTLQWLAPQMSRLCALALEHGIEPAYVTELIRLRHLAPPSLETRVWPWPVKIHTLGRFELLKDDQPLRVEGKTQRKPLALLKVLIALGGSEVPENKLIEIVWADESEGDVQKTFDVTLHRLRKLLGHDKAIQVTDRRVSLNRDIVWVDLWALERHLAAVIPIERANVPDATQLERAAPAVMELYRGHFLHDEPDAAWLLPVRNRLSGRFQRFVMRLGDHWEAAAQWPRAAELFERAVELDPLAEEFHRRWMVCLRELGQHTEAINVFRRLRQLLSVSLGVKPGADTEAVYRGLMGW